MAYGLSRGSSASRIDSWIPKERLSNNKTNRTMGKIWIREVSKASEVEILGHIFNGLDDITKAVESYCRIGREPWDIEPKSPVDGIHVLCVYQPYPCFDAYDYANEDRDYCNYFFSTKPFTRQQIMQLNKLPGKCNARIVDENLPEWAVPAVYYGGEGDKMILATL